MNLIIFGPPGAGKGTQADFIVNKFNLFQLSTGEVLRNEIKNDTNLGKEISSIKFQEVGNMTLSFGVAECGSEETWEQWLHRADEALYLAKSGGRDQVKIIKRPSSLIEKETTKVSGTSSDNQVKPVQH